MIYPSLLDIFNEKRSKKYIFMIVMMEILVVCINTQYKSKGKYYNKNERI